MTTWLKDNRGNKCHFEKWVSVSGYRGLYEVSNFGRVRSVDRENVNKNGVKRTLRGKMLRLSRDGEGYAQVGLLRGGMETKARVHRLVATSFLLNDLSLPLVDHIDRDRANNDLSNLRWASFADNRANNSRYMKKLAEQEASAVSA
jgi:hypothetical protein